MKVMRKRKIQSSEVSKFNFLFNKHRMLKRPTKIYGRSYDASEIGKAMADEVDEKIKLNLDI